MPILAKPIIIYFLGFISGLIVFFIIYKGKKWFKSRNLDIYNKEDQLNIFLTNMPDFMYIKDTGSRFVIANKKNSDVFHFESMNDLIGKRDIDLYPKEFAEKFQADEQNLLASGKPLIGEIEKGLDENGNVVFISTSKYPIYNNKKQIIGLVGIGRDVSKLIEYESKLLDSYTELKKINSQLKVNQELINEQTEQLKAQSIELEYANEQLTELIKTRDKFFSIIAHDLKNPVNLLKGFAELLLHRYNEIDDVRRYKYIETVFRTSNNLTDLLEKLLQWARMQTGGIRFDPEVINIYAFIEENLAPLTDSFEQKNITVESNFQDTELLMVGDRNMLDFVFRNLLTNAMKYTNRGGHILILCDINNNKAQFCVSDNGIGMEEHISRDLFSLTRNRTKEGTEGELGSGLGLFLCKDFIERNRGKIWVESKIGEGTKVYFYVPLMHINN